MNKGEESALSQSLKNGAAAFLQAKAGLNSSKNIFAGMLGPKSRCNLQKKTLAIDLDETLVHSSFKPVENSDIILPVLRRERPRSP